MYIKYTGSEVEQYNHKDHKDHINHKDHVNQMGSRDQQQSDRQGCLKQPRKEDEKWHGLPRCAVLLGNKGTKRTDYFCKEAEAAGLPVMIADWRDDIERMDFSNVPGTLPDIFGKERSYIVKIDPPLWDSFRLGEINILADSYKKQLEQLSRLEHIPESGMLHNKIEFFNHPRAIVQLLDKRECKAKLVQAGLPVTEELCTDACIGVQNAGKIHIDKSTDESIEEQITGELRADKHTDGQICADIQITEEIRAGVKISEEFRADACAGIQNAEKIHIDACAGIQNAEKIHIDKITDKQIIGELHADKYTDGHMRCRSTAEQYSRGITSAECLLEQMRRCRVYQVFIKPVNGSGAAGVSAFRWQPSTGRMRLYTCAFMQSGIGLVNTKRLRCFKEPKEVTALLDLVLQLDCVVERWYAKAEYQGYSYDLRAVMQEGSLDFLLARLSKGPITNLHLNNCPLETDRLGLSASVSEHIEQLCRKAMECFPGLRSAGIDILLEKGSGNPRIIEMNAQGDLIYQDIFHENKIYRHQVEIMQR